YVIYQQSNFRFDDRKVAAFQHSVAIPASWQGQDSANEISSPPFTLLKRRSPSGSTSVLELGTIDSIQEGVPALLQRQVVAAGNLHCDKLAVTQTESWNKYYPGAVA